MTDPREASEYRGGSVRAKGEILCTSGWVQLTLQNIRRFKVCGGPLHSEGQSEGKRKRSVPNPK